MACHFVSANYVFDRMEFHKGDKLEALRRISITNLDRRTWFWCIGNLDAGLGIICC